MDMSQWFSVKKQTRIVKPPMNPPRTSRRSPRPPAALHWNDRDENAFFRSLAGGPPPLRRAAELAVRAPAEARRLVLEYFRKRTAPRWLFDFRREKAATFPTRNYFWAAAIDESAARDILEYRVPDPNCRTGRHDLGPDFDWRRGDIESFGSSGWLVLHFWYWALFAAAGYAIRRDPRYARVFERAWRRWQQDYPFEVDPAAIARGGMFSAEHSVMRAGRRLLVLTDLAYSGLLDALDDAIALEVLEYLWFVSGHYLRLPRAAAGGFRYHPGNHNLFDAGVTPYCLGMIWPEFDHARELRDRGLALIRRHLRSSIHPDFTSVEHSSRYAWYIANMYVQAAEIARLNRDPLLTPSLERKLRGFLWTLVELTAPGGRLIPYGDCQPPPAGLQLHTYRALFHDRDSVRKARAFGLDLAREHAPAAIPCTDAPPGRLRRPAKHFRHSGMVLVRDGDGPHATLLWLIADPRKTTGHGHLDFTSFQLWAQGVPLVHDTSGYGYRIETIDREERAFYYSPFGHSLLTVDDLTPVPLEILGDPRRWWGPSAGDAAIDSTRFRRLAGEVRCRHRSYPGVTVRRTVRFDLAARWVEIEDRLEPDAVPGAPHTCEQRFFTGFGLEPVIETGSRARVRARGLEAAFTFTADVPLELEVAPCPLIERAATVFGYAPPRLLLARARSPGRSCRLACRIDWRPGGR